MRFSFDQRKAAAPVKVSWRIKAATMARLEEVAKKESVEVEQVAQQMLDHVLAELPRKQQE
jgi:hypothetical protein